MCRTRRWIVRTPRHKIGHLLYEWTTVSTKPDELIEKKHHESIRLARERLTDDIPSPKASDE